MNPDESQVNRNEFDDEHAKRDGRISREQQRVWADGLIASLPDSLAYRKACTPQARLADQALQNQWVEDWKSKQREQEQ